MRGSLWLTYCGICVLFFGCVATPKILTRGEDSDIASPALGFDVEESDRAIEGEGGVVWQDQSVGLTGPLLCLLLLIIVGLSHRREVMRIKRTEDPKPKEKKPWISPR